MPAEGPLGDLALAGSVERDPEMFQLINGPGCVFCQDFYGVLIPQIVTALDRIKHVPFPAVFLFVA